jgi:predicted TIM-barrel fold metal-dependent hydrolase
VTRFVDVHVHPPLDALIEGAETPLSAAEFGDAVPPTGDQIADHYRAREGMAVVHAFDAETTTGVRALSNRRLAELVAAHPDVLVGLGSVDPHRGAAAVGNVADAKRLGLHGLFFHPPVQRFDPSSRLAAPLWEMAADLRLPVVVHCGTTLPGEGRVGGAGVRLDRADPFLVDAVAATHPDLRIVIVDPNPLWEERAAAVVRHKGNVWLALPGTPPDRWSPTLRGLLTEPSTPRIMCGTGYPITDTDAWLAAWSRLDLPEDVSRAVLVDNAAEVFGLDC